MDDGGSGDLTETSLNDLPADVVMDILSRLPAKTLIRFSSVRKSFYSLIRTPVFISKHLHFHTSNTSHLLIVPQNLSSGNPCSLLCDNDKNTRQATFDLPPKTKTPTASVLGSSNGLVCIEDRFGLQQAVYLWNPSICSYKTLPPSCFSEQLKHWSTYAVFGFGFCEFDSDYKVVRVVYRPDDCGNFMGKVKPEVEVYSLKKDSWSKVAGIVVPRVAESGSVAFANGGVHWLAAKKILTVFEVILAFDLKDEVFRELGLPKKLVKVFEERAMGLVSFGIKEFGGSLSLFVNCFPSDESWSVWWMKEYGNAKSWTKQFTVVLPHGKVDRVFVFTKNGKIIAETYDRKLVSYDPEKKNVQDIVLGDGRYGALGTFTESLVMLERRKRTFF